MSERKELAVTSLLVDTQNPRLPHLAASQPAAIREMITIVGARNMLNIADDIAEHQTDPTSLPMVMESPDEAGFYVVLEGNRRVTALKILAHPELAADAMKSNEMTRLRRLADKFRERPIRTLLSVVVRDRNEADHWITLRHRGLQQGRGLKPWGATESARYDVRRGGKKDPALQVIDFVEATGALSPEVSQRLGDLRITNLQRLLNDKYVRDTLGIAKNKGEVFRYYPPEVAVKGLQRIVEDLALEKIDVYTIDKQADRKKYIDKIASSLRLSSAPRLAKAEGLEAAAGAPRPATTRTKSTEHPPSTSRTTIIPRRVKVPVSTRRINAIYHELKSLNVDKHPNAGAVLLRVFIELSVDTYLLAKQLTTQTALENPKGPSLSNKLQSAANQMKNEGVLTAKQLQPVSRAVTDTRLYASSVSTFHAYVHNPRFTPKSNDLKDSWDDLEPFIAAIWS